MLQINLADHDGEVYEYLSQVKVATYGLANDYVAKVAKNARTEAGVIEKNIAKLDIQSHSYWKSSKGKIHVTKPYWDASSKLFRTSNRKAAKKQGGKDYALQYFSFSKTASSRRNRTIAQTNVTSQFANLFEEDVHFSKRTPSFGLAGKGQTRRFPAGAVRKGRHYFKAYYNAALTNLPQSQDEALGLWKARVEGGKNY